MLRYTEKFVESDGQLPLECGSLEGISDEEEIVIDIIYWARNRGAGFQGAMKIQLFPGPHGKKDKKGWWWPNPSECCDQEICHYNAGKEKTEWDPWIWFKHCKTKEHIAYLVRHRKTYIMEKVINPMTLLSLATISVNKDYPLHIHSKNKITQAFVLDALSGKNWDIKKQRNL